MKKHLALSKPCPASGQTSLSPPGLHLELKWNFKKIIELPGSRKVTPLSLLVALSDISRLTVVGQLSVQVIEGLLHGPVMARIL